MTSEEWGNEIQAAALLRPYPVTAHTYLQKWSSYSGPVLVKCDNGKDYVIKGKQVGRAICNEQIIGHLGEQIGAPVGKIGLVDIPPELTRSIQDMGHVTPGTAHGT